MLRLLEVIQHVVHRLEGHVRAMHHFLRRLARGRLLDDFRRLQPAARDLVRRFLHTGAVVGEIDRDRGGAGRHDAEEVAVVHELLRHVAEQTAYAVRVTELEMKIVDDKNDDASGGVVDGPRWRQDDALTYGRSGCGRLRLIHAAAVDERKRRELLFDAVFVDFEIVLGEIGLKLAAAVSHDHVRADQVDRCPERRVRHIGLCGCGCRSGCRRLLLRAGGRQKRNDGHETRDEPWCKAVFLSWWKTLK